MTLTNGKSEMKASELYELLKDNELANFDPIAEVFRILDRDSKMAVSIDHLQQIFQDLMGCSFLPNARHHGRKRQGHPAGVLDNGSRSKDNARVLQEALLVPQRLGRSGHKQPRLSKFWGTPAPQKFASWHKQWYKVIEKYSYIFGYIWWADLGNFP